MTVPAMTEPRITAAVPSMPTARILMASAPDAETAGGAARAAA
jgi:hypothetical protein